MKNPSPQNPALLRFSQSELTMLGHTADALSAFMGCSVLAEVGHHEDSEWVIFARALGKDEATDETILHVQMGGPEARLLGQQGGLDATAEKLDCAFLWAIELSDDADERFVRLDQDGEVFDTAADLQALLPFSLEEPPLSDLQAEDDDDEDPEDDEWPTGMPSNGPQTLH